MILWLSLLGNEYRTIFWFMITSEAISRMKNADLREKNRQR